jgi:HlyD family secretion protein
MQINNLDQQILDLKLQKAQEESRQKIAIEEAFENLKSQINKWGQTYLVKTPITGKVTFTQIWSKNQNVQMGEVVATVIPEKATNIIGKVVIPSQGVGKVKIGQTVNIKFDNFPHMEFGLLRGSVKNISLVPTVTDKGTFYTAEIEIPDTLVSNYGKTLKFSQEMTGTAEIITDDIRLLERFLNPLRSIWMKNVD